ncbi:SpoU rRNA methylase [Colletotrichum falcatum]|nr:SpoU rRNA methylase [Colletotrichum falcatum]
MSLFPRLSICCPLTTSQRVTLLARSPLLSSHARNASLSAIHRGIWRSDKGPRNDRTGRPDSRSRLTNARGRSRPRDVAESKPDAFSDRFSSAMGSHQDGPRHREQRQHFKPKKAFRKMQEMEEEGGRKSRSKRFNDPESSFGKKSLVYQLNRGELKDKVSKLLEKKETPDEDPPRSSRRSDGWNDRTHGGRQDRYQDSRRPEDDDLYAKSSSDFPASVQYTTAASQFLYGRSVVKAVLQISKRQLYHLYLANGNNKKGSRDDEWILRLARKKKIKVTHVHEKNQKMLDRMSQGRPHNGMVIEASPLPQLPLKGLGAESSELRGYPVHVARQSKEEIEINGTEGFIPCERGSPKPLVLLLNEILDPGNLGAILRTARFLGVSAVAITQRTSADITPTVLKAAAGAAEELRVFSVEDPAAFLDASQKAGWTSYAAVAPTASLRKDSRQWTPEGIEDAKPLLKEPVILVLGNEGTGLPHSIRKRVSHEITIPRMDMSSLVDSLNVSVAAALLCNSFLRGVQQPLTLTERLQKDARKADGGESLF